MDMACTHRESCLAGPWNLREDLKLAHKLMKAPVGVKGSQAVVEDERMVEQQADGTRAWTPVPVDRLLELVPLPLVEDMIVVASPSGTASTANSCCWSWCKGRTWPGAAPSGMIVLKRQKGMLVDQRQAVEVVWIAEMPEQ